MSEDNGNGKLLFGAENSYSTRKTDGKLAKPCGDLLADTSATDKFIILV